MLQCKFEITGYLNSGGSGRRLGHHIRHPDGASHWERHILEHKSIIHKAVHTAIRLRPRHTFIQSYSVRQPESYLSSEEVADWSLSQGHKIQLELPIIFC